MGGMDGAGPFPFERACGTGACADDGVDVDWVVLDTAAFGGGRLLVLGFFGIFVRSVFGVKGQVLQIVYLSWWVCRYVDVDMYMQ